jgi:hypothetical protein
MVRPVNSWIQAVTWMSFLMAGGMAQRKTATPPLTADPPVACVSYDWTRTDTIIKKRLFLVRLFVVVRRTVIVYFYRP